MTALDPVEQTRAALLALKAPDPDGWPESLVRLAGVVAGLDPGPMDLLADAAVQMAATAHQLAHEQAADDAAIQDRHPKDCN